MPGAVVCACVSVCQMSIPAVHHEGENSSRAARGWG